MGNNNEYRAGWAKNEENHDNGKLSSDAEYGQPRASVGYKGKDDPFGDETNSEVKYRVMAWW